MNAPGLSALFLGFMRIGLAGVGGVLPHARHALVERNRWLTESEFNDFLSTGQLLPGPNIVNVAIMTGHRFRGVAGALAATVGLMGVPLAIVLVLALFYREFSQWGWLKHAFIGISAAAAGLIFSVGVKLARNQPRGVWAVLIACAAFVAVAVLRLPMLWVVGVLAPLGLLAAARLKP
jgi:chromate transporter